MESETEERPLVEVFTRAAIDSALRGVVNQGLRLSRPHYDMRTNCLRTTVIDSNNDPCYTLVCWFSGPPMVIAEPLRTPGEFLQSMRTGFEGPSIKGPHYVSAPFKGESLVSKELTADQMTSEQIDDALELATDVHE